ncbi:hypothetical protein TL16_g03587 [Triparma laevis f. inornata]|uniref:Exostosin GT47 domain-containing protein n=1 Tax=Triparma laevis f. inornata TaxID=1714386 RepID=A0A9W6ZZT1_9STRA|nr:hypothetical protein TL16_g03587 [Triparma laevis f. inornata]
MLASECRTLNMEVARWFYVPAFPTSVGHLNQFRDGSDYADLAASYDYLAEVHANLLETSPYYSRKNGTDHIFAISHDIGSCLAPVWISQSSVMLQVLADGATSSIVRRYLGKTGGVRCGWGEEPKYDMYLALTRYICVEFDADISLDPEVKGDPARQEFIDRSLQGPCFVAGKDIVIPPFIGERYSLSLDAYFNKREKDIDFYFRGSVLPMPYSFGVRQWLSEKGLAFDFLVNNEALTNDDLYWRELTRSLFCFSPPGWFEWSPRTYQAIAAGCIPVVIKEKETRMPFEGFVSWNNFAVFVDLENYVEEVEALMGEVKRGEWDLRIEKMQAELKRVWRVFTYGDSGGGGGEEGGREFLW